MADEYITSGLIQKDIQDIITIRQVGMYVWNMKQLKIELFHFAKSIEMKENWFLSFDSFTIPFEQTV